MYKSAFRYQGRQVQILPTSYIVQRMSSKWENLNIAVHTIGTHALEGPGQLKTRTTTNVITIELFSPEYPEMHVLI